MASASELTVDRPCDLCGGAPVELYPAAGDRWRHVRCGCGLIYVSPLPSDLRALNERLYGGPARRRTDRAPRAHALLARARARGASRLLDVGCGGGEFLAAAADRGLEAVGVDCSPDRVAEVRARGLVALQGSLEEVELAGPFDLIRLNHVVEHVPSPRSLFLTARKLLAPSGEIVLATPNAESLDHRVLREGWRHLGSADNGHLVLLSPETLERYAAETGLRVLSLGTRGTRAWSRKWIGVRKRVGRLMEQGLSPWTQLRRQGSTLQVVLGHSLY